MCGCGGWLGILGCKTCEKAELELIEKGAERVGDEARSTCAQAQLTECWVKSVVGGVWVFGSGASRVGV